MHPSLYFYPVVDFLDREKFVKTKEMAQSKMPHDLPEPQAKIMPTGAKVLSLLRISKMPNTHSPIHERCRFWMALSNAVTAKGKEKTKRCPQGNGCTAGTKASQPSQISDLRKDFDAQGQKNPIGKAQKIKAIKSAYDWAAGTPKILKIRAGNP